MSIGKIGNPYKIIYASKNFVSGLNDISINILNPNGTIHSSGLMSEINQSGFEGIYEYTLNTNSVDPDGQYTASIVSPSENHRSKTKATLLSDFGSGGDEVSGIEIYINIFKKKVNLKTFNKHFYANIKKSNLELNFKTSFLGIDLGKSIAKINVNKKPIELKIDCC